jgi:hypothetical protein
MRCMACGEEMRVVEAVPDESMARGFEHHVLRCPGCNDEERRLAFVPQPEPPTQPIEQAVEADGSDQHTTLQPSIEPAQKAEPARKPDRTRRRATARGAISAAWDRSVARHRERWDDLCRRLGLQVAEGGANEDEPSDAR